MNNQINDVDLREVAGRKRTKGTLGGWRPGAGRKGFLKERRRLSVDFDGTDFARLREIAEEREVSTAEIIRRAVKAYLRRLGRR